MKHLVRFYSIDNLDNFLRYTFCMKLLGETDSFFSFKKVIHFHYDYLAYILQGNKISVYKVKLQLPTNVGFCILKKSFFFFALISNTNHILFKKYAEHVEHSE